MPTLLREQPQVKGWIVSWMYNGKYYHEFYTSYIQALNRYWKLEDNNSRSISVKD